MGTGLSRLPIGALVDVGLDDTVVEMAAAGVAATNVEIVVACFATTV
jgi:hypothetical protein